MANFKTSLLGVKNFKGSKIELLAPAVAKWEGGYVNDPLDRGGATNMGITIGTWKLVGYDKNNDGVITSLDIKLLDRNDFKAVLRRYWDKMGGDQILDQNIANILVDWYWGSGKWAPIILQRDILGFKGADVDGVVGPGTLAALNNLIKKDALKLHTSIFDRRVAFLNGIVKNNPTQKRFIKGWLNRLNDFKYKNYDSI